MLGIGFPELLVIFLVIFLLFGANALPEIAKALGQAVKIFRKEMGEVHKELESAIDRPSRPPVRASEAEKISHGEQLNSPADDVPKDSQDV